MGDRRWEEAFEPLPYGGRSQHYLEGERTLAWMQPLPEAGWLVWLAVGDWRRHPGTTVLTFRGTLEEAWRFTQDVCCWHMAQEGEVPQPTWELLPDAVATFVAGADEVLLAALERAVGDQRRLRAEGPARLRDDELHLVELLREVDP
jgi:hypothetical protein